MAGSTRAESALNNLEGSFAGAQHNARRANLERPGSFRESLENRSLAPGLCTSRNVTHPPEIAAVSRFINLEPILLGEQKVTRSTELKRVLGVPLDEQHLSGSVLSKPLPPIATEELKQFKGNLQETSSEARARSRFFHESLVKLDKCSNILSKKRQRRAIVSSEKSGSSTLLKSGSQINASRSDLVSQRLEERTKDVVPNKRARSSMPEVRVSNRGSMPSDGKVAGLLAEGDGWEKKLKRKRSVGTAARTPDGERDLKLATQPRLNDDTYSRSCDGLGSRPGASIGTAGINKMDPTFQVVAVGSHFIPRNEWDNALIPRVRRERASVLEKEQIIAKGSNKINIREDAPVGSQSPLTKGKGSRTPRAGPGVMMNTPNFSRSSGGIDGWEQSPSFKKLQPLTGATNRKRTLPTGSSSPPVVQWASQRPQTISRGRRANVVSPVSNFDDVQILSKGYAAPDVRARVTTSEISGLLLSRDLPSNSHQIKLKLENVASPAGISESEESGATENRFSDKIGDNCEVEYAALNVVHKTPTVVFPLKKNKVSPKEESGDAVRRQGRSGRGPTQSKACLPEAREKLEIIDTSKPPKSGRPGSDKSQSRVGRPPSKKVSDRKTPIRSRQIINGASSELTGELNDDREELLSAGNAARNASHLACSGLFWKRMEPYFAFISPEDINYVKQQIHLAEELDGKLSEKDGSDRNVMSELACKRVLSTHTSFHIEQVSQSRVVDLPKYAGIPRGVEEPGPVKRAPEKLETEGWSENIIPLSQRLLSAFIAEDGTEDFDCSTDQASSKLRSPNIHNLISVDAPSEEDVLVHRDTGGLSDIGQTNLTQLRPTCTGVTDASPYECQIEDTSLDDRILMELHSIGLYPETVPDLMEGEDEEIDKVMLELKTRLSQEARKKKNQLFRLQKSFEDKKGIERNLEQLAMNKLVEISHRKFPGGRRSHGSGHKGGGNKVSKQLAMAFAKRTLARCRKYEETGQSCFSEPALRDMLFSKPLYSSDAIYFDGISNGAARNMHVQSPGSQFGPLVSGIPSISEGNAFDHKLNRGHFDPFNDPTHMAGQSFTRKDQMSIRGKQRDVLLNDVVTNAATRAIPAHSNSFPCATTGKKSDGVRNQIKDTPTKTSTAKAERLSLGNGRGERKTRTKPKQKIAQLSSSGNGLAMPSTRSCEPVNVRVNQGSQLPSSESLTQHLSKETEDSIFRNLPLHGIDSIDELDGVDGLGGQGQDIGSWLSFDEEALQDQELMGLEIPMDDLSDLKMNF